MKHLIKNRLVYDFYFKLEVQRIIRGNYEEEEDINYIETDVKTLNKNNLLKEEDKALREYLNNIASQINKHIEEINEYDFHDFAFAGLTDDMKGRFTIYVDDKNLNENYVKSIIVKTFLNNSNVILQEKEDNIITELTCKIL